MSIDIAVIDINRAINEMNSLNGSGEPVATFLEMRVSGEFELVHLKNRDDVALCTRGDRAT
jgi:hypothetical protein